MWDFLRYISGERIFNFFQDTLETTRARAKARARAQASRTALKIRYKSSLEYLGTLVAAIGDFSPRSLSGCLEISYSGVREESERAMKRATEVAMEGCS